jgi:hypothetical protein
MLTLNNDVTGSDIQFSGRTPLTVRQIKLVK